MLICKLFLRKFIHEITSIITFNCRDNYSDIQQNSTCKVGRAKKKTTKNVRGAREIVFAAIFVSQIICCMFYLKEKQTTFCIIIRRMTTVKGSRAVGIIRQGAGIRQESRFFPKMFTNPGLLLTNVTVYDKPN